jgi:hypothetical protein
MWFHCSCAFFTQLLTNYPILGLVMWQELIDNKMVWRCQSVVLVGQSKVQRLEC